MKHIGIIAEYNPFHNGHLYQINELNKAFPEKKLVICLSGDYVQRGEPAVFPRSLRTKCALLGGADLIIELPHLFSSASSEHFAAAGINALYNTGIVDTVCFGAECDDIDKLSFLADLFLNEPENYKTKLKEYLSSGISFPKARLNAVKDCFPDNDYDNILLYPNNILAIEYIKAIKKYNIPMTPFVIKRSHDNHNSLSREDGICSSTALRNTFNENKNIDYLMWKDNIPENVLDTLRQSSIAKPMFFDDMYPILQYRLISDRNNLSDYFEMTEEFSNTINNLSIIPESFNNLIEQVSSKNITVARIRRAFLNIVLSRTKTLMREYQPADIGYIRILGVKKDSTHLIKEINNMTNVPVINKTGNAKKILSAKGLSLFDTELYESMIYRQIFYNKYGIVLPTEYEQSVIIL